MSWWTFNRHTRSIKSFMVTLLAPALSIDSDFEGTAWWIANSILISALPLPAITLSIYPIFIVNRASIYTPRFGFGIDVSIRALAKPFNLSEAIFTDAFLLLSVIVAVTRACTTSSSNFHKAILTFT